MNSDAQAENVEAIFYGLEPPHADVWVCDLDDGVLWLTLHTDAHRLAALRVMREAKAAVSKATLVGLDLNLPSVIRTLDALLKGEQ